MRLDIFPFVTTLFLFFSIHAFFGWILETAYRSYHAKSFVNAGFLFGPFVPLYGFGALLIYSASIPLRAGPVWAGIPLYAVLVTVLEYSGSWVMEKWFALKLWDYSGNRFNLKGRVCLSFSLFWAFLAAVQSRWLQPFFLGLIGGIELEYRYGLSAALVSYFAVDVAFSSRLYLRFSRTLGDALQKVVAVDIPDLIRESLSGKDLERFLRPLRKFPHLSFRINERWDRFSSLVVKRVHEWADEIAASAKEYMPERKSWRDDADFMAIASPILEHEEYLKLKDFHHHENNIYMHNVGVAYLACRMGRRLKLRERDLVRGALLHDFFFYDWRRERPESGKKHAWEHPKISLRNARKHFGPLTAVEKDIISKHMWPLNLVPPLFPEAFVVMLADKIVASKEFAVEFFSGLKGRDEEGKRRSPGS